MSTEHETIETEPTHELYESCDECFYADLDLTLCRAMACKHAFNIIKECFKPREVNTIEPLTDKEKRIFLLAIEREKKICEEVDKKYIREPYEDSLVQICREIKRKVKTALWKGEGDDSM